MPRKPRPRSLQKKSPEAVTAGKGGRRIVSTLARSTLLAAGLVATHFTVAEIDPRCPLFSPTLLDRLHSPVTRIHE